MPMTLALGVPKIMVIFIRLQSNKRSLLIIPFLCFNFFSDHVRVFLVTLKSMLLLDNKKKHDLFQQRKN